MPTPSLRSRFWRLCLINIASNLTIPLVGLVDTAMLGHLPELRFLAGVALASLIFDYLFFGLGFLRMTTTGQTAQAQGRGDDRAVEGTLARGVVWALGLGLATLLLAPLLEGASFRLLSGTPEVEAAGRDYFRGRIWGAPAALLNLVLVGWFLGREQSGRVLLLTVVANLTNVALNYWFILRLGWAAYGAGLASALAQGLMALLAVLLVLRSWPGSGARPTELLAAARDRSTAQLNLDLLVRTLLLVSAFAVFTNLSALFGTVALAANTLLLRILSIGSYFIDGAAYATESLAGRELGRGDRSKLREVLRLSLIAGEAFAWLVLLPTLLAPRWVFGLLTSHDEVVGLATSWRWWLVPTLAFGAFAYILDGFFLGLTAGRTLRNAMLASALLGFGPLALWAAYGGGPTVLWIAMVMLMAARTLTLAVRIPSALAPQA
ncbi:MAG: MATE family efflux transporter [Acidobacteriota bacterium]